VSPPVMSYFFQRKYGKVRKFDGKSIVEEK
jgi:hypothetical protein